MLKLFLGSLLVGAIAVAANDRPEVTIPAVETTAATTTTTVPMRTTTTTYAIHVSTTTTTSKPRHTEVEQKPQTVALDTWRHPEWIDLARQVGWPEAELEHLDYVIHRESRGEPDVWNRDDPMSGSRGLVQVNGFWCKPNRYERNPAGFLGAAEVLDSCDDLFDPETNLRAALAMWQYADEHGCGWGPWRTKTFRPCA